MKIYGALRDLDPNNFPDHPVQTPEDLYGDENLCPECDASFYGTVCPDCEYDLMDDAFIEPDPDDYYDDYRADYPERYGLI